MACDSRFKTANELFRNGDFETALSEYRTLYANSGFSLYRWSIDICLSKLGYSQDLSTYNKVCICSSGIMGPTGAGGIATAMANLAISLAENGMEVTILYAAHPYYARKNYEYWKDLFRSKYNINFAVPKKSKYYGTEQMIRSYESFEFIRSREFDCAIFHDYQGLGYYSAVASRLGLIDIDIVINGHGNIELSYQFGSKHKSTVAECITREMERLSIKNSNAIVSPSSQYLKFWSKITELPSKSITIPNINSIDTETGLLGKASDSDQIRIEKASKYKNNYYFYSRLERLKGLDLFIDFCIEKTYIFPDENFFWFYGTPVKIDNTSSDEYIKDRLKNTNVQFELVLNPTPSQFFADVRNTNGILIFPSLGENSPCTVAEACNYGVPLLSSDIPGVVEMLDDVSVSNCLFRTGDVNDLIRASSSIELNNIVPKLSYDHGELYTNWFDLFFDLKKNRSFVEKTSIQKISVVIPTIGRVDTLGETLSYFMQQTLLPSEIVVVDDGSSCSEKISHLCQKFGAKYIRTEKIFKGAACNVGSHACSGDVIIFFDDDDLPHIDFVRNVCKVLSNNDVDIISTFASVFEKYICSNELNVPHVEYISMSVGGELGVNLLANYFGKGCFAIKKSSFDKIGGFDVDHEQIPFVDYRFYIKCYVNELKIQVLPLPLYYYRKNSIGSLFEKSKNSVSLYKAKRKIFDILSPHVDNRFHDSLNFLIDNVSQPKL